MKITPLAFDSFGARSMSTFMETKDANILIDPGVSLAPKRFGYSPHPIECAQLKTITDDMCIAVAEELANFAEERASPREAVACALKSIEEEVARVKLSRQELWERAVSIIKNARESAALLM